MLKEIINLLGVSLNNFIKFEFELHSEFDLKFLLQKNAPILSEIECPENREGASNSVGVRQKKGPCICKPQTCPLVS